MPLFSPMQIVGFSLWWLNYVCVCFVQNPRVSHGTCMKTIFFFFCYIHSLLLIKVFYVFFNGLAGSFLNCALMILPLSYLDD